MSTMRRSTAALFTVAVLIIMGPAGCADDTVGGTSTKTPRPTATSPTPTPSATTGTPTPSATTPDPQDTLPPEPSIP